MNPSADQMTDAYELITRCAGAGVVLFLKEQGAVGFRSARTIPLDLLADARQAKAAIGRLLAMLQAEPAAPCPDCFGRQFWRYSGVSGPAGPWMCRACVAPAPGEWTDAAVLPLSQRAEAPEDAVSPAALPAPPGGTPEAPCAPDAAERQPMPRAIPDAAAGRDKIREAVNAARTAFVADPASPCPQCDGRYWWRYRSDAGGAGPWLCRACDPPAEDMELSEYDPAAAVMTGEGTSGAPAGSLSLPPSSPQRISA